MGRMKRRNSPFSPFSVKFDAEILLSLYREGMQWRVFRGVRPMPDLFSLEQRTPRKNRRPAHLPQGP